LSVEDQCLFSRSILDYILAVLLKLCYVDNISTDITHVYIVLKNNQFTWIKNTFALFIVCYVNHMWNCYTQQQLEATTEVLASGTCELEGWKLQENFSICVLQ
jgi:hypothetical protein